MAQPLPEWRLRHSHTGIFSLPGSGKTMLARRLPDIYPEEAVVITKIYSISGNERLSQPATVPLTPPYY